LSRCELGLLLSPAFWGNTVANVLGGSVVDFVGNAAAVLPVELRLRRGNPDRPPHARAQCW
jgi:hypothetical protein